ncbi:MAG: polysaccharide biosynthesis protein [Lachnospiraceae bacterium]|nr:polysaccharide biosynthesis protein [Clostridium sp.]MDD6179897.1 polysaccharide biosynthesis protein [Clostridium sp.]MDY4820553.1 polysaccharide biosynthesis protein [Lachnospiraceae bacterium]
MLFCRNRTFIKGTLILTLTGLLSRVIGFFYRIYLSRLFGEEGMGIYQLLSPVLALSFSLCAAGIQTAISKYVAASVAKGNCKDSYRYLFTGLFLSLLLSVPCMLLLLMFSDFVAVHFLLEARTASMLRIIALSIPAGAVHSCINGYYYGIKKTMLPSSTQLIEQFMRFFCVLAADFLARRSHTVPHINAAVVGLVVGECAAMLISLLAIYFRFYREEAGAGKSSLPCSNAGAFGISRFHAVKNLLVLAFPLTVSRIVVNLLQSVEAVAIPSRLCRYGYDSVTALSVYGVLTGMALPLLFFPNALTGSMSLLLLPMVSEADAKGNTDAVKNTTLKTIHSCLLLGAACTLFFFLSGPFLGRFLFHSELAGRYIRSLSLLCPFLYLCTTLSGILHGLGKAVSVFFVNVFSLSLRLLFVFFLIPAFGIDCYILSMVLSQLLSAFFYLFLLYRKWN